MSYVSSIHNPDSNPNPPEKEKEPPKTNLKPVFNTAVKSMCDDAQGMAKKVLEPEFDYQPSCYYGVPSPVFFNVNSGARSSGGMSVGSRFSIFALAGMIAAFTIGFISKFSKTVESYVKQEKRLAKEKQDLLPDNMPTADKQNADVKKVREIIDLKIQLNKHQKDNAVIYRALVIGMAVGCVIAMIGALFGSPLLTFIGIGIAGLSIIIITGRAIYNACTIKDTKLANTINEKSAEILKQCPPAT